MEKIFINLLSQYGYLILFIWAIMEGETGLVMAGVLSHTGQMNIFLAILFAGLGAFTGDQIYYYLGRSSKKFVQKKLYKQRRKFALARQLLSKHGWFLIFMQRYMYGLRTIIPMTIGIVGFDKRKFAIINLLSAYIWASIGIVLSYIFGQVILDILNIMGKYWYYSIPLGIATSVIVYMYIHYASRKKER